jgi:hypothetical protein
VISLADHRAWVIGRTPFQRKEQEDRLVPISPRMHTNPFLLPSISELALNRVVKLGKGVDNTSFVTGM